MLGRVRLVEILCSGNTMTDKVRELVKTPRRRNYERKSKSVKRFVRTGLFSWDTMFWDFSYGVNKKSCRNTVKNELRKEFQTC